MTILLRSRWLAIPFAASLLLAACGDDDDTETDTGGTTTDAGSDTSATTGATTTDGGSSDGGGDYGAPGDGSDTSGTTAPDGGAASGAAVQVGEGGDLGDILVDADGMTLYAYANDTEGASTCNDQCATAWPPYLADATDSGDGVTAELSVIERDDGDMQIAANGQPLYYFAGDAAPGDANGQGTLDVWHVVDPAGEIVES